MSISQLSEKQRTAYTKTLPFIERGLSITEATRRAKVKTSDFNNARNRLRALKTKPTDHNVATLTLKDLGRFEEFMKKAISAITKRVRR